MEKTQTQLDPSIVAMSKAIGQSESGGNYTARGKSGEFGAYQYTKPTWAVDSKKYLGQDIDIEHATPAQQDEVMYKKIEELGKQGYKPDQIASIHNSGKPEYEGNVGTNKFGVHYDTPAYVKSVGSAYEKIRSGQSVGIDHSNPSASPDSGGYSTTASLAPTTDQTKIENGQPNTETLGGQIANRINEASKGAGQLSQGVSGLLSGNGGASDIGSGALHVVGSVAGMVGDATNKLIEKIPYVKKLEGFIGEKVGNYIRTPDGQQIIKSLQDFSTKNPKLSQGIGDVFNIATAIPILKAVGVVKDIALSGASKALVGVAEKTAIKDFTATAERTIGGRKALQTSPNAVKTLIKERAIPDVVDNKYSTKEAFDNLTQKISHIEDNELQPTLARLSTEQVAQRQSIDELRKQAIADVKKEFKGTGDSLSAEKEINRKFDGFKNEYGDYVTLQDVNEMKRGVRTSVNFNSPKLEGDVSYQLGQVFQKNIEETATKMGLPDVGKINRQMSDLIKAQNMLKHIEGKPVKTGVVGGMIQTGSTGAGAALGTAAGFSPETAAFLGYRGGGLISKKLGGLTEGVLKRTGSNAIKPKDPIKKIYKGVRGALIQKSGTSQNELTK